MTVFLLILWHFICALASLQIPTLPPEQPEACRPHPKPPGRRLPVKSLYNQPYSAQTFIGTHNSVAIRRSDNNWSLSGNQYYNISNQLESGVRLLQAQGHRDPNGSSTIRLCHFNCALMDGGSLDDFLHTVLDFLHRHPAEVVTLLFVNTGPPLRDWARSFYTTNADLISYVPPRWKWGGRMRTSDWPSPADMVQANKRLITFLSSGANQARVPFLLPEFDYMFETNFWISNPNEYGCQPTRPRWPGSFIPDRLSLVNHFLYAEFLGFKYPNASYANFTNGAGLREGQLGEHAARCRSLFDRRPNFFMVDFFNEGNVFDVEYGMNAN